MTQRKKTVEKSMSCAFGMSVLESTLSHDSATRWMHQLVKMKVTTTNS